MALFWQDKDAAEDVKDTIRSLKTLIGLVDEVEPDDAEWVSFQSVRKADGNAPREKMVRVLTFLECVSASVVVTTSWSV